MSVDVPRIYCRLPSPPHMGIIGRAVAAVVAAECLALLVVAAWLRPDPSGTGTHQGLGLGPCQFKVMTGLPCPSCGMTTSFSYFVRGNLLASLYVQPMGMILAALCAAAVWGGVYVAATGRPVHRLHRFVGDRYKLTPLMAAGVLAWAWKIFLTLSNLDGWR